MFGACLGKNAKFRHVYCILLFRATYVTYRAAMQCGVKTVSGTYIVNSL